MENKTKITTMETEKEQFLSLAKEVYPLIEQIRVAIAKRDLKSSVSITIGESGYMEFRPYNGGWKMAKYSSEDKPVAQFEYQEKIILEEE